MQGIILERVYIFPLVCFVCCCIIWCWCWYHQGYPVCCLDLMQIHKDFSEADLMSKQASNVIWKLWIFILPTNIIIIWLEWYYHDHTDIYKHLQQLQDSQAHINWTNQIHKKKHHKLILWLLRSNLNRSWSEATERYCQATVRIKCKSPKMFLRSRSKEKTSQELRSNEQGGASWSQNLRPFSLVRGSQGGLDIIIIIIQIILIAIIIIQIIKIIIK